GKKIARVLGIAELVRRGLIDRHRNCASRLVGTPTGVQSDGLSVAGRCGHVSFFLNGAGNRWPFRPWFGVKPLASLDLPLRTARFSLRVLQRCDNALLSPPTSPVYAG